MDGRITRERAGDTTHVTKRVSGGDARLRLAHEAAVLESLDHPGVVTFVGFEERPDHAVLVTESAGAATLADHRPATVAAVAGLGAAVAEILADLHQTGLAHGAIQADHVVLGASRHPVLCSFGRAGGTDDAIRQDVMALADLVTELLEVVATRGQRGGRQAGRAVQAAADEARRGEVDARQFARLLAAVPDATLPSPERTSPEPDRAPDTGTRTWRLRQRASATPDPDQGRRHRWIAASAVVVVGLVATGLSLRGSATEAPGAPGSSSAPGSGVAAGTAPTSGADPSPVDAPPDDPAAPSCGPGPDVDGDGCGDDTEVVGRLIRVGDVWYSAGRSGDVVAVDHWGCADLATPAVLRPATGEVFVFDQWPRSDQPRVVVVDHRVAVGATSLSAQVIDGCPAPVAGGAS